MRPSVVQISFHKYFFVYHKIEINNSVGVDGPIRNERVIMIQPITVE